MENRGKKVRIKALKIRVPRPEVAGLIHAVGYGVTEWKEEQLVGVGWHGEHWPMQSCRCEDFFACCNEQMTITLMKAMLIIRLYSRTYDPFPKRTFSY